MNPSAKRVLFSCGVALILLPGCGRQPDPSASASTGAPPAPVRVAAAELKTLPVEIRTIGNVEAYNTISVKSQIGGTLMKVNFKEGDSVRQGQLLFEIDPRPYQEAIRQLEANLDRDTALAKQAEANLARDVAEEKFYREQAERYQSLARQGIFSRQQADQAVSAADSRTAALSADHAAIESARSAIQADRAGISNAKLQLGYCSIFSPVDGRSGNISVKEGNLVKATDVELVTLTQIQPIYVTFTVPEKNLPAIRERMRSGKLAVRAIPQGGSAAGDTGTLTFVNNMVDQATATIKLKGTFTNSASSLWPGQFVDVVLTLGQRPNLVTVPYQAVQVGQSGRYVFVLKGDQTVEMRNVVIGDTVGGLAEVQQGVQPGEQVVTEGHVRLASGTRVRVLS
jgi:membrane fusion protein, multidrug efflux system